MDAEEEIALTLETEPALLPHIPELLADLGPLGSSPHVILDLLRPLGLPSGTQVLDLGCGKGAVSITLAKELGFRVTGVDLFLPFIQECVKRAEDAGVSHLCQFRHADMRDALQVQDRAYDVAVYVAIGGILGDLDACVRQIRQAVQPGGYMVIGDGYLNAMAVEREGYEHYVPHDEAVRLLTAHGDRLVREMALPDEEETAVNRENNASIRARAERLSARRPELAETLAAFVKRQEDECEVLETQIADATWLLQRA